MKFDMSGGAAVARGRCGRSPSSSCPCACSPSSASTENTINGSAMKPGDIVRAMTGTTIEVNNTDAEGRLVLCDCLAYAVAQGAERIVDVATLTGGIVTALGSTYAGLFATDEELAAAVTAAGATAGEIVWRMPLHAEYDEQMKGRYADLTNSDGRKAHPIQGASFLKRFVGDVPWAHLDIAGHRPRQRPGLRGQGRLGLGRAAPGRAGQDTGPDLSGEGELRRRRDGAQAARERAPARRSRPPRRAPRAPGRTAPAPARARRRRRSDRRARARRARSSCASRRRSRAGGRSAGPRGRSRTARRGIPATAGPAPRRGRSRRSASRGPAGAVKVPVARS